MNTYTLLKLVQRPEQASAADLEALKEESRKYPYFQAVRVLLAKIEGSSEAIKTAAAHTANRAVLMKVINKRFNPDVNLPNIDHLDIQKEDINAFEKLGRDDDDFKTRLEALAEGNDLGADEDDVRFQKDSVFDETFLSTNEFDTPEYDLDAPITSSNTSFYNEDEPSSPEGDFLADEPIEASLQPIIEEEAAPEDLIDSDLMASIAEMRKVREKAMLESDERDRIAENLAKGDDSETNEPFSSPLTVLPETASEKLSATDAEATRWPVEESSTEIATHALYPEDDPDYGMDDEMRATLAELRKGRAEAMRNKEIAEARMDELEAQMREDHVTQVKEEQKQSLEVHFPEPEYTNPFTESAFESAYPDSHAIADDADKQIVEDDFLGKEVILQPFVEDVVEPVQESFPSFVENEPVQETAQPFFAEKVIEPVRETAEKVIEQVKEVQPFVVEKVVEPVKEAVKPVSETFFAPPKKQEGFFTERPNSGQSVSSSLGHEEDDIFGLDAFLEEQNTKKDATDFKHSVLNLQPFQHNEALEGTDDDNSMTLEEKKQAQLGIIDAFIANPPKMAPKKDALDSQGGQHDLAQQAMNAPQSFISENLASIMVRQGKYDQAIKIYSELMLKYPEKKSYFADLIENLQNKQ